MTARVLLVVVLSFASTSWAQSALPGSPFGVTAPGGGLSTAALDALYLRLDATNDPVTGDLTLSSNSGRQLLVGQNSAGAGGGIVLARPSDGSYLCGGLSFNTEGGKPDVIEFGNCNGEVAFTAESAVASNFFSWYWGTLVKADSGKIMTLVGGDATTSAKVGGDGTLKVQRLHVGGNTTGYTALFGGTNAGEGAVVRFRDQGGAIRGGLNFENTSDMLLSNNGPMRIDAFSGTLKLSTVDVERVGITSTGIVVNDLSNDFDFRVETNNDANAIFVNSGAAAANESVSFFTASPIANTVTTGRAFVPDTTDTLDLGTSAQQWNGAYAQRFYSDDGSVGAPNFTFDDDSDTGLEWHGAGVMSLMTNGVGRLFVRDSRVEVDIAGTATDPAIMIGNGSGFYDASNGVGFAQANNLVAFEADATTFKVGDGSVVTTNPTGLQMARLIGDSTITKPACTDATTGGTEGTWIYVDDTTDAVPGQPCVCMTNNARTSFTWVNLGGGACAGS